MRYQESSHLVSDCGHEPQFQRSEQGRVGKNRGENPGKVYAARTGQGSRGRPREQSDAEMSVSGNSALLEKADN